MESQSTRADGGSARTRAQDLDGRYWQARPWASRAIRLTLLLAPLALSIVATRAFTRIIDRPDTVPAAALYWVGMLTVAMGAAVLVERGTRSLLPLAAVFRLSLAFPDQAPSRFRVALRRGTSAKLQQRLRSGELDEAEAAATLLALVSRVSAHDRLTRGHSERVRAYSDLIGEELGLPADDRDRLQWAALVHDVGKLAVPAEILNKADRPDDHEWDVLRGHPAAAADLVAPLRPWLGEWARAATEHHERWDGGGYPRGLAGERISLAGRIVAVADAYDTMTSRRSYKPALAPEVAREELTRNAGSQFDPRVVRAFLAAGLGRVRPLVGPLAWLNELVWITRIPQGATATGGALLAATTAVALPVIAPTATETAPPLAVERSIGADMEELPDAGEVVPSHVSVAGVQRPDNPGADTTSTSTTTSAPAGSSTTTTTTTTTRTATATTSIAGSGATTATSTPPTTTVGSAATTTAAPVTTSTAVPTTTAATTVTAAPPTTLPPTRFAGRILLGGGGVTTSQAFLELGGALEGTGTPNLDADRNDDPGLTVKRGKGLAETDGDKIQRWKATVPASVAVRGVPVLDIWVATEDFRTDADGVFEVGLAVCDRDGNGCKTLSTATAEFGQETFGADFGRVRATLGPVDAVIDAGRSLVLTIAVVGDSERDLWFAYGTTTHPAELRLG